MSNCETTMKQLARSSPEMYLSRSMVPSEGPAPSYILTWLWGLPLLLPPSYFLPPCIINSSPSAPNQTAPHLLLSPRLGLSCTNSLNCLLKSLLIWAWLRVGSREQLPWFTGDSHVTTCQSASGVQLVLCSPSSSRLLILLIKDSSRSPQYTYQTASTASQVTFSLQVPF